MLLVSLVSFSSYMYFLVDEWIVVALGKFCPMSFMCEVKYPENMHELPVPMYCWTICLSLQVQHGNGVWYSCHVWLCYSSWKDTDADADTDANWGTKSPEWSYAASCGKCSLLRSSFEGCERVLTNFLMGYMILKSSHARIT